MRSLARCHLKVRAVYRVRVLCLLENRFNPTKTKIVSQYRRWKWKRHTDVGLSLSRSVLSKPLWSVWLMKRVVVVFSRYRYVSVPQKKSDVTTARLEFIGREVTTWARPISSWTPGVFSLFVLNTPVLINVGISWLRGILWLRKFLRESFFNCMEHSLHTGSISNIQYSLVY